MKDLVSILLALVIALGGGTASVLWALDRFEGLDALQIGVWAAHPLAGTAGADAYARARAARTAEVPLGHSEGIAFTAKRDDQGEPLRRECAYRIEGNAPAARFFTLHARDAAGTPIAGRPGRAVWLLSTGLLRGDGDALSIGIGRDAAPGNWLAISGEGPMTLVMTLYDTPVASNERIGEIRMPRLVRTGCAA